MSDKDLEIERKLINFLTGLTAFVILIPLLWIFVAFNDKFRRCIYLENGASIGYEAVFDVSRPLFKPISVPRLRDGTPLVQDETWALRVTSTTLYGSSFTPGSEEHYEFAWRPDTGRILPSENSDLYEQLIAEAGPRLFGTGEASIGTGALLNDLLEQTDQTAKWCPTSLITW